MEHTELSEGERRATDLVGEMLQGVAQTGTVMGGIDHSLIPVCRALKIALAMACDAENEQVQDALDIFRLALQSLAGYYLSLTAYHCYGQLIQERAGQVIHLRVKDPEAFLDAVQRILESKELEDIFVEFNQKVSDHVLGAMPEFTERFMTALVTAADCDDAMFPELIGEDDELR